MCNARVAASMAALVVSLAVSLAVSAQDFPTKPIRIVVPATGGTASDIIPRTLAPRLEAKWGHPLVVVNQPGGGGAIAMATVMNAPADGYTLIINPASLVTLAPLVIKNTPFSANDLEPVALLTKDTLMPVSAPQGRFKSIDEIREVVRQGRDVRFGTLNVGGTGHIIGLHLANVLSGLFVHVPYRDFAIGLRDLIAGDIDIFFAGGGSVFRQIEDGRLNGVAVPDPVRRPCIPNVKTFREQGVDLVISNWFGVFAGKGTPKAIVSKLNADINAVLSAPEIEKAFSASCLLPAAGSPEEFGAVVQQDIATWKSLLAGVKVEVE